MGAVEVLTLNGSGGLRMPLRDDQVRRKSRITKDEWREHTKTVWSVANVSHGVHRAVFPVEIPHWLIKLFVWYSETLLDPLSQSASVHRGIEIARLRSRSSV